MMDYYSADLNRMRLIPVNPTAPVVRYCLTCELHIGKRILCETTDCPWCGHNRTTKGTT